MPRTIDVNTVVRPLAQDAPVDAFRRQQADTALLVGQVVSNMREIVMAKHEAKSRADVPDKKPRFDVEELEKELAALQERLRLCRSNLAANNQNPDGKLRFLQMGEKREAALTAALQRLQSQQ